MLVRNVEKAKTVFGDIYPLLYVIVGDISPLPSIEEKVDYIVYAVNPTSMIFFENLVEIMSTALNDSICILGFDKER